MPKTYHYKVLADANHTLNSILDLIVEGTWDWHADSGQVDRSPGWYRMLGYEVGVFNKDVYSWENIIHPDDYEMVMRHFENYITGKTSQYQVEYRCKKADGSYLWIEDRGHIIDRHQDGSVARMIGAHLNIHEKKMAQSELIQKNQLLEEGNLSFEKLLEEKNIELEHKNTLLEKKIQEVERLSVTDTLTNIANRRKFESMIEKEVARASRYKHALTLVMFDIDYFKRVNDRYGHKTGDQVLKKVASVVKSSLRINDSFARWGGEEFVIVMPETNREQAIEVSNKLRQLVNHIEHATDLFITCSFGVTEYQLEEAIDDLFARADEALLQAKELGRNRVEAK